MVPGPSVTRSNNGTLDVVQKIDLKLELRLGSPDHTVASPLSGLPQIVMIWATWTWRKSWSSGQLNLNRRVGLSCFQWVQWLGTCSLSPASESDSGGGSAAGRPGPGPRRRDSVKFWDQPGRWRFRVSHSVLGPVNFRPSLAKCWVAVVTVIHAWHAVPGTAGHLLTSQVRSREPWRPHRAVWSHIYIFCGGRIFTFFYILKSYFTNQLSTKDNHRTKQKLMLSADIFLCVLRSERSASFSD